MAFSLPSWLSWRKRPVADEGPADVAEPAAAPQEDAKSHETRGSQKKHTESASAVIWINDSRTGACNAVEELARAASETNHDAVILFTSEAEPDMGGDLVHQLPPRDSAGAVREFLDRWRPAAALFFASNILPSALYALQRRGIPVFLVCDVAPSRSLRATMKRFSGVFAFRGSTADALVRTGLTPPVSVLPAPLSTGAAQPEYSEAERQELAQLLAGRPVWLAAFTTEMEDDMVVEAHAAAARLAHRLLLILVPDDPSRGPELAKRLAASGWRTALRSADHMIDAETQIYVADTPDELGLWVRLSPITFLGGSIDPAGAGSADPIPPASHGSAIMHGKQLGKHAACLTRLDIGHAARVVHNAADMALVLNALTAPDKTAELAHNGWRLLAEEAESTQTVVDRLLAELPKTGEG